IGGPLVAMQQSALRTEADQNAKKANRSRIQAENTQFVLQDERERALARVYATTTSLAYQKWLANDIAGAEKLLDSTPTRFREWEFDYLKRIFHTELMTLPGHTGAVEEVRYSMDGKRIVSIQDGLIHVWDTGTGSAPKRIRTNSHEGYFSVSSNGQWFASNRESRSDGTLDLNKISIVPILNGGESIAISGEEGQRYLPVVFSQNGDHLLTYDFNPKDGSFRFDIWDLPSRKRIQTWEFSGTGAPLSVGSPKPGLPAALSPDGKQVAFRAQDGSLVIHDVPSGKERHRLPNFVLSNDIDSIMTFSPDGRRLAASDADGGIWVHDVSTGARQAVLLGHAGEVYGLSFSPDGRRLISGGADMSVRLWDVASMRQIHIYRGHTAGAGYGVLGVAFSSDGRRLVSSGYDMVVKVWDASFGEPTATETADNNTSLATEFSVDRRTSVEYLTLSGHQRSIEALSVSLDGTRAATASLDGTVQIVDLNSNERLLTFTGHDGVNGRDAMVGAVAFSPDGRLVASGSGGSGRLGVTSEPGYILLWNSADGQLVHTLVGHKFPISQLQFTPDGKRLVSSSGNPSRPLDPHADQPGEIMVWEVASGKQLLNFSGVESPVMDLAVSPDATTVATGHWKYNSGIQVWDLASGQRLYSLGTSVAGFTSVEYSPDGTLLAGGGTNWEVALWDVAKRTELWNQKGHGGGVFEVTFTGNGSRLISASEDRTLKIWNPQTGDDLLTLNDGDTVYRADISSDGRFLVSAGESGKIRVRKAAKGPATETDQWPIMLADDFERDELGARWTVQLGSCSIEEGVLKYELEKGSFGLDMTFAQLRLNDLLLPSTVDVSFDFWTPHELNCAANFHNDAVTLGVSGMFMGKGHVLWNSGETGATVLAFHGGMPESINTNSNFSIEPDRRYRFRILREPTRVRLFVDGEEMISSPMLRMPGHVFIVQALCGQAGDVAYLDNLKIRAPQSTASELKALSLVEDLHDDLPVMSIVMDRIENHKSLSDSDKQQALEIVAIRKQEDIADAVDLIWKRLVSGRDDPGIVQSFLRYADERARSAPESVDNLRILAIAQLRSGDARGALQTLAIHEQRYRAEFGHADAVTSSLFALAHHQLKNESDVHRYIAQVDDLLRSQFFAGDVDASQLAEQARKLVSASHAVGDKDRTAIRDITFLPQQAVETGHDLDAWRKQWAEDARIVRGRDEKPGPYDVVRTLEQEIAFQELESRTPPPMADRLVRDVFHIEIKDNRAEVRQEIVSGGIRPGTEGQHPGFDRRGYLLELTKLASGWAITAQREWGIESKNGLQAALESQITHYDETLWAKRDNKVTEVRKSNDSKSLRKALFQAARFHEALQVKPGESEITDGKYWAHQVLLARNLEDVQNLQNAVDRLVEIQPATPPFLPILRDVSARKNLSEKPTSFKHGIRLRLPTYVTSLPIQVLRLPGEVCGAWNTASGSVAGIYMTEFEEPQSADDILENADIEELFKAMGATILSKRAHSVGTYPSVSYLIEGMGNGNSFGSNGLLLTRGRWVLVPHGKQVFYFLFVSPAIAADALNAEFEVILQTLSFGKDKPLAVAQPMPSLIALKQIGLAMHNHHAAYRSLPGNIVSEDGKPLLSWRVAILPFIEQLPLYQQFHLDESWDSEH
ncbi:MAG: DUF1559 domain-containing protein, partial [Rubripirellula sp.]|nr:DUF1559 domain-containing protein [Rubripirellula sp.]